MDRDTVITTHLRDPGTCLRVVRIAGRGAYVAALAVHGKTIARGSGTSLVAALDALASELTTREA